MILDQANKALHPFVHESEKRPLVPFLLLALCYAGFVLTFVGMASEPSGFCGNCNLTVRRHWWYFVPLALLPLYLPMAIVYAVRGKHWSALISIPIPLGIVAFGLLSHSTTGKFHDHESRNEMVSSLLGRLWWLTLFGSAIAMKPMFLVRLRYPEPTLMFASGNTIINGALACLVLCSLWDTYLLDGAFGNLLR